jgi:hypothetical protein
MESETSQPLDFRNESIDVQYNLPPFGFWADYPFKSTHLLFHLA